MSPPKTSTARLKQQFSTKNALNQRNLRQNEEVKKELMNLIEELTAIANDTKDPDTRARLKKAIADGPVKRLRELEEEDIKVQRTQLAITEYEAREAGVVSIRREKKWRPSDAG